jgi:hypothetical protein
MRERKKERDRERERKAGVLPIILSTWQPEIGRFLV